MWPISMIPAPQRFLRQSRSKQIPIPHSPPEDSRTPKGIVDHRQESFSGFRGVDTLGIVAPAAAAERVVEETVILVTAPVSDPNLPMGVA